MLRRITILLSVVATLLLVESLVRRHEATLLAYHRDGLSSKFDRLAEYEPEPQVLLLGSSRAHFGLVPDVFQRTTGYSTFNLGISASTLPEWRLIARRALHDIEPRLVVVGINARMLRADGVPLMAARQLFELSDLIEHSFRYEWSNELIDDYLRAQVVSQLRTWRYTNQLRMWIHECALAEAFPKYAQLARERRALVELPLPSDGFDHPRRIGQSRRTLPELIEAVGADYLRPPPVPKFSPQDEVLRVFDDLLVELRESGATVLVCYLPNSPRTEAVWHEHEPLIIEIIATIAANNGVTFLDASVEGLPRSDADFIDDTHVDLDLAERISLRVAENAIRLGLLDKHSPQLAGNLTGDDVRE